MSMLNPYHHGEIICELCLEPLGLSVTNAAKVLGIMTLPKLNVKSVP